MPGARRALLSLVICFLWKSYVFFHAQAGQPGAPRRAWTAARFRVLDAPEALRALFELEKQLPERDVVLVRADSSEDVRLAFRNYFSDAREFIKFIENGCEKLTGNKYLPPRKTKKSASDIGRQKP